MFFCFFVIVLLATIPYLANGYAHLFDSPVNSRIDNDVSGHSPTYIPVAG